MLRPDTEEDEETLNDADEKADTVEDADVDGEIEADTRDVFEIKGLAETEDVPDNSVENDTETEGDGLTVVVAESIAETDDDRDADDDPECDGEDESVGGTADGLMSAERDAVSKAELLKVLTADFDTEELREDETDTIGVIDTDGLRVPEEEKDADVLEEPDPESEFDTREVRVEDGDAVPQTDTFDVPDGRNVREEHTEILGAALALPVTVSET